MENLGTYNFLGDCDRVERLCIEEISVKIDERWVGSKPLDQWFSNFSEVSNPTGVMQAYIEPLIITRSGSGKF